MSAQTSPSMEIYVDPSEPLVQVGWIVEGDLVAVIPNDMSCEPTIGVLVGLTKTDVTIHVVDPRSLDYSSMPSSSSRDIRQTAPDELIVLHFSRQVHIVRRARECGLARSRSSGPAGTHLQRRSFPEAYDVATAMFDNYASRDLPS